MNNTLIIIPTYNEAKNIGNLINTVNNAAKVDILVIDDNSPDKTYEIAENLLNKLKNLYLIKRAKKSGLGTAYIRGFKFALEKGYKYIMEMDADLSHNPEDIPRFLKEIKNNDLVIGSRYLNGINVINWPIWRISLSFFASKYIHFITGLPFKDPTSGFKCFKREVLEAIDFDSIMSKGYAFQIETHYKVWKKNFKIKEISIIFTERDMGEPKISIGIIWEAIWIVWKLRFGLCR